LPFCPSNGHMTLTRCICRNGQEPKIDQTYIVGNAPSYYSCPTSTPTSTR
jgi:hypothetical protein